MHYLLHESVQTLVLLIREGLVVTAFEFDADRIVIAIILTLKTGHARMPCSLVEGYKLLHASRALYEYMCRYSQTCNLFEKFMLRSVEAITEKVFYTTGTIAPRG